MGDTAQGIVGLGIMAAVGYWYFSSPSEPKPPSPEVVAAEQVEQAQKDAARAAKQAAKQAARAEARRVREEDKQAREAACRQEVKCWAEHHQLWGSRSLPAGNREALTIRCKVA